MKIIKSYKVDVYEDGSLKIREDVTRESKKRNAGNAFKTSRRIFLIIEVLKYVREHNKDHVSAVVAFDAGIATVSQNQGIARSTVIDKFCRQMGLNMEYWKNSVANWIKSGDCTEIKNKLLKNCCKGYEDFDTRAIVDFFS